jgi:hypothetical protein
VLETFVRYSRVLQAHQHVIPSAVTAFLDERGMGHAAEDVAARACYLFCRLVKSLRAQLRQHASTVLQSLQPHLVRIATVPIIDAGGAAAGRGDSGLAGTGAGATSRPANAVVDDRLYVFEAVGLLLGQEDMPAEEQGSLLSSLLQPLREQIESNLSMRSVSSPSLVLQAMECVVRLNKGFKSELVTRTRPQLGRMFTHFLEVAIQVQREGVREGGRGDRWWVGVGVVGCRSGGGGVWDGDDDTSKLPHTLSTHTCRCPAPTPPTSSSARASSRRCTGSSSASGPRCCPSCRQHWRCGTRAYTICPPSAHLLPTFCPPSAQSTHLLTTF